MRQTKYYHGYGYITTGTGIFDSIAGLLTNKAVTDVIKEGVSAAGKSAAQTIGSRAGEKIANKIIRPSKPQTGSVSKVNYDTIPEENPRIETRRKVNEKDVLKKIYGDGLKTGRGLKRI
jgi:hypothetical protein